MPPILPCIDLLGTQEATRAVAHESAIARPDAGRARTGRRRAEPDVVVGFCTGVGMGSFENIVSCAA